MRDPDTITRRPNGQFDTDAAHPEPTGSLNRESTSPEAGRASQGLLRSSRSALQVAALPQEMTGDADTDAQFCVGVAERIARDMRIRQRPQFERTPDGSMLTKITLGPRSRAYTVLIGGGGSRVTVTKLSQDQRNNPYAPEALATDSFAVIGGPATPSEMGGMITDAFNQTRWWQ